MSLLRHRLVLLRHGETAWSKDGRHTSHTDLELTETGQERAKMAAEALAELELDHPLVMSSPLRRGARLRARRPPDHRAGPDRPSGSV